jgi:hypothetical protein
MLVYEITVAVKKFLGLGRNRRKVIAMNAHTQELGRLMTAKINSKLA